MDQGPYFQFSIEKKGAVKPPPSLGFSVRVDVSVEPRLVPLAGVVSDMASELLSRKLCDLLREGFPLATAGLTERLDNMWLEEGHLYRPVLKLVALESVAQHHLIDSILMLHRPSVNVVALVRLVGFLGGSRRKLRWTINKEEIVTNRNRFRWLDVVDRGCCNF